MSCSYPTIAESVGQVSAPLLSTDLIFISRDGYTTTTISAADFFTLAQQQAQQTQPTTFYSIKVDGQPTLHPTNGDPTFIAGENVVIATDPSTNKIVISANSLDDPGAAGFVVRTTLYNTVARSLVASTGIDITNPTGVDGNPTISNTGVLSVTSSGLGITPNSAATGAVTLALNSTPDNIANTIVYRNEDGDFSARIITADQFYGTFNGTSFQSQQANKLTTPRLIELTGEVTGSVLFDGSQDVQIVTTIFADGVTLGADTVGQYAQTVAVSGLGISANPALADDGTDYVITSNATSANTAETIVYRDATGSFSAQDINLDGGLTTVGTVGVGTDLTVGGTTTLNGDLFGQPTFNIGSTSTTIHLGNLTTDVDVGNFVVQGSLSTLDPIVTIGEAVQDNKDRGIEFNYHDGLSAKLGFFGWDDSASKFVFLTDATNTNEVITGTTASIEANAATADRLSTARNIELTGDVVGSALFDGSQDILITATVQPNSVELGVDTFGNYVANAGVAGNGLTGVANTEAATFTVVSNATNLNVPETIVFRDTNGDFSAGYIDASVRDAARWTTSRLLTLSGDVTGSASWDGSTNLEIVTTVAGGSVELGTDTTGNYVAEVQQGPGIVVSGSGVEGAIVTVSHADTSTAVSAEFNSGPTIVQGVGVDQFGHVTTINSIDGSLTFYTIAAADAAFVNVSGDTMTGDLQVPNLTVTGNLTVQGTTTTVDSTTTTISDPVITLASDATAINDGKSRGVEIKYGDNTNVITGFFGVPDTTIPVFTFYSDGSVSNDIASGTVGAINLTASEIATVTADIGTHTIIGGTTLNIVGGDSVATAITGNTVTISFNGFDTARNITLTGDVEGTNTWDGVSDLTIVTELTDTGVTPGQYGTANSVPVYIVDIDGRLVSSTNQLIDIGSTQVNDFETAVQNTVGAMVGGNIESGISVTYDGGLGKLNFDVNDFQIDFLGDATGTVIITDLASTSVTLELSDTGVVAGSYGSASEVATFTVDVDGRITAAASTPISIPTSQVTGFTEDVQDVVGNLMIVGNVENGISVTYDDNLGKLNFDVADFTITLVGDVTGTATVTNLGNVTINTTSAPDSVVLGTDTLGNYVEEIIQGPGVLVSGSGQESAQVTIAHANTSAQPSVVNSGNQFIQSIELDQFGHIATITTAGTNLVGDGNRLNTDTTGFAYMTNVAGTPTGTPATIPGYSPFAFDPATNTMWIYNGTAWVSTVLA